MNPIEPKDHHDEDIQLVEVIMSDNAMVAFIKLQKSPVDSDTLIKENTFTEEQLRSALQKHNIIYGIKENSVKGLAERPIYGIKIEVAKGLEPIDGENGYLTYLVKKDDEYKPDYNEEGTVDYKNLEYFQMVKKGQVLCEITKETPGTDGMNVLGFVVPAKSGRTPVSPIGKNTELNEEGTQLIATKDGVVRYVRDVVDVSDILIIPGDVDQLTGNIIFTGDVRIDGHITEGFSVKVGGNLTVKGVVEAASIEAAGNVIISQGINGSGLEKISVGGDLQCKYIERAIIYVQGNLTADYIADSNITCLGNIELSGKNELLVGGITKIAGQLKAKDIGNENERLTKIEFSAVELIDTESIEKLKNEKKQYENKTQTLIDMSNQINVLLKSGYNEELDDQLNLIKKQLTLLKERADRISSQIQTLETEKIFEYPGFLTCKRKIYQGVKINFGPNNYHFQLDNIEHCKIYYCDGEVVQGVL